MPVGPATGMARWAGAPTARLSRRRRSAITALAARLGASGDNDVDEEELMLEVAVIGGGPAGLMAAGTLAEGGAAVTVYEAKPSVGRKFLLAGRSGLNLTHAEPLERFVARYGAQAERFARYVGAFTPDDLRAWLAGLGIDSYVGTSGRVFPKDFKASITLRAWLRDLAARNVVLRPRHRWLGFSEDGALLFDHEGERLVRRADAVVLALGGASWPRMGSDAAWVPVLAARGVTVNPFRPANCGFTAGWSQHFRDRHEGEPLKNVALSLGDHTAVGELSLTRYGVEGGCVYALGAVIRDAIDAAGRAVVRVDLKRDLTAEQIRARLDKTPRGRDSLSNHLRKALRLSGAAFGLLRECCPAEALAGPAALAQAIKAVPLTLTGTRPIEEAISSAGGIAFSELDEGLMLKRLPGIFAVGEMLDWEAPTGGYLLQGCFSTGRWAARSLLERFG